MKKNILLILLLSVSGRMAAMNKGAMDNEAKNEERQRLAQEGLFFVIADTQQMQRKTDKKVEEVVIKQEAFENDYTERIAAEELEIERLKAEFQALKEQRNKPATVLSVVPADETTGRRLEALESVDEQHATELVELRGELASLLDDQKKNTVAQNKLSSRQFWTTCAIAGAGAIAFGALVYAMKGQQAQIDSLAARPIVTAGANGQSNITNVTDNDARKSISALEKKIEAIQKSISESKANPTVIYTDKANESLKKEVDVLQKEVAELQARTTINFEITKLSNVKDEHAQAKVTVTLTDKDGNQLILNETGRAPGYNKHRKLVTPGSYSDYQNTGKLVLWPK